MMRKQLEIEPENFDPNKKSIKFLGLGVKTRVGRVSGNNTFLGLYVLSLGQTSKSHNLS